jgi:hypothetical protein
MEIRNKAGGWLIRGALLIVALAAFAIVINLSWFDEALDPALERLKGPEPVSMEDNAYPLVYGFPAADDTDPRAAGLAIIEILRERYREGQPIGLDADEMEGILGAANRDEGWQAGFKSLPCNSRLSIDCVDGLLADVAAGAADRPRVRLLVGRYERILQAGRFEENREFDATTPLPNYGLLMTVGRIRLAERYASAPTNGFIASLAEDIAFWRRMLREGQSLVAKMVALAGIRNDLEFCSALMRQHELDDGAIRGLEQATEPLTDEERDIGEAFLSELRIALLSDKPLVVIPGEASWLTRLLLQENATLNEYYVTKIVPLQLRASLDPATFYREHAYEPLTYNLRVFPPPLFNLGGKLVLKRMASTWQDYITRVHDLEGRMVLVSLQAEIESHPDLAVETVIRSSVHRNPYTGEPMDYDAAARTIRFDCLANNAGDVCAVALAARR